MKILVAGVGNVLWGDDGFGVEVVKRLSTRTLPEGVHVVDFGVRGMDMTYALLDGYDAAILVDAAQRGGAPGTLYVIEPEVQGDQGAGVETHGMHPSRVLSTVRALGGELGVLRVVACEPETFGDGELAMGLSGPVSAAIEPAADMVERLVLDLRHAEAARA